LHLGDACAIGQQASAAMTTESGPSLKPESDGIVSEPVATADRLSVGDG